MNSEKQENLCSIFHARFSHLRKIIPNIKQAQLMDYILLGWQTSTYKLKNSNQKWFMKEFSKIVEDTGIALSTLKRYLKEFEDEGLIERRQALYSRSTESGFDCKKGCYISVTPKLVFLLNNTNQNTKTQTPTSADQSVKTQVNNTVALPKNKTNTYCKTEIQHDDSKNLNQNETFEKLNLRLSNIRDLYTSHNNNINDKFISKHVDKYEQNRTLSVLTSIEQTLFNEIKEELPNEVKTLVYGTLANLIVKHKVFLSSPKQVTAEYVFALINIEFFMKDVQCIKHRNNILAKLLRTKQWRTPKGFYNHFYLGINFRDKNEIREKTWEEAKQQEIKRYPTFGWGFLPSGERHPRLLEIDNQIGEKSSLISKLEDSLLSIFDREQTQKTKDKIELHMKELRDLWTLQAEQEREVDDECNTQFLCFDNAVA